MRIEEFDKRGLLTAKWLDKCKYTAKAARAKFSGQYSKQFEFASMNEKH